MKLSRKDFQIWKDDIYFLPTIEIVKNNMMYGDKNFSICLHFLVFHVRFLFLESEVWKNGKT